MPPDDPRPQGDGNRQPHAGQLFRRRMRACIRTRQSGACASGSWPRGPTCSIWGANRAARGPSRFRSTKSCAGSSRSSRPSRATLTDPAFDRYDQGRGRPPGAPCRRRHHQRHLRAGRRPGDGARRRAIRGPASSSCTCKARPRRCRSIPHYDDVVTEVYDFLARRVEWAVANGIPRERIAIDPGIGFGKTYRAQSRDLAEPAPI